MERISALIKTPESSLADFLPCEDTRVCLA